MRVIGLIPARLDSSRYPKKMITDLCGKPLIQHTFENAQRCPLLDDLIIATDSPLIKDIIDSCGGKSYLTSNTHTSGTDRIAEVVQNISADIVVNIQGDEPFLSLDDLSSSIQTCIDLKTSIVTLAHPVSHKEASCPNNVKVVLDADGKALLFSRSLIPFHRHKEFSTTYLKHIGVYVYPKDLLLKFVSHKPSFLEKTEGLEQLRALENGIKIHVNLCEKDSLGVDTSEDFALAKKILKERNRLHD
ncbi:3-deoxy-D-manno-octulosonate cytidylyltransferase [PVC group bacterium (ex Bugula neritina AB1)]|nr:3-deoxy-D-manno-octulosonate cytidylyltransferase [PVC group bacterium (ex Bugula neritina AB1)]